MRSAGSSSTRGCTSPSRGTASRRRCTGTPDPAWHTSSPRGPRAEHSRRWCSIRQPRCTRESRRTPVRRRGIRRSRPARGRPGRPASNRRSCSRCRRGCTQRSRCTCAAGADRRPTRRGCPRPAKENRRQQSPPPRPRGRMPAPNNQRPAQNSSRRSAGVQIARRHSLPSSRSRVGSSAGLPWRRSTTRRRRNWRARRTVLSGSHYLELSPWVSVYVNTLVGSAPLSGCTPAVSPRTDNLWKLLRERPHRCA
jgi:hypothetical protein